MRPILFALLLLVGCSTTQYAKTETTIAKALISDQDEELLGEKIHQQLAAGEGDRPPLKYSSDAVVTGYVDGLINRLSPIAQRDRKSSYHVHVIDDPKTVNAFATPGGHLYVYTGLLLNADTEAEVIGVLAHELGHVTGHHAARQLVNAYGLQTVAGLALGKDPNTVAKIATNIASTGALLAHSRADENEADQYAVRYASEAGYDPRGITTFFTKLMAMQGKTPRVLTWLSTHPATADRITRVNQLIEEQGLKGSGLGAERLAPIKQRLTMGIPVSGR